MVAQFLQQGMEKSKVNPTLISFARNVVYYSILAFCRHRSA